MKTWLKLFLASFMFAISWTAFGDEAASVPTAVASSGGLAGWVAAHGGWQATALLFVWSANAVMSAVRDVLLKFDGVGPGEPIPADKKSLTLVNRVCLMLGKVLDYLGYNPKH